MEIRSSYLLYLLIALALFNSMKWSKHLRLDYQALDFRTYSLAAKAYFEGDNPYDNHFAYRIYCKENNLIDSSYSKWDSPHNKVVYAPQFVWYMYPFTFMSFNTGKWVQLVFNLTLLLLIVRLIHKCNPASSIPLIFFGALAFKGTWFALDNGQPLFFCVFLMTLAWYLFQKTSQQIYPGILLGFACFKFTLIIPLIILLLILRAYKMIFSLILTAGILNIAAIGSDFSILESWTGNMSLMWEAIHLNGFNQLNIISTGISAWLAGFSGLADSLFSFILWLFALGISTWTIIRKKLNAQEAFLILFICELSFGQHLIYDCLILIPAFFYLQLKHFRLTADTMILILTLCLPLGALAERINLAALNHLSSFALLFCWLRFQIFPPFSRNKVIKNPS